jgi:hypothetical protein
VKVSELCRMIEDSVKSGRYPLETETQKKFASSLQVTNKSGTEDLHGSGIVIETKVHDLYVVNNYVPNIQHVPGAIEVDVLDSFKMICRKLERLDTGVGLKRLS